MRVRDGEERMRARDEGGEWRMRARDGGVENESEGWESGE